MPEYSDDSLDLGVGVDIQPETQQAPVNDENPFEKEKFDAGIDVDEEQDPKKYIERLSGKLAQSLRAYNETNQDSELNKFAANSVISAAAPNLGDEDIKDVIKKVEDSQGKSGQESVQIQEPANDEVPENQPEQGVESGQEQEPMQDEQPPVKQEENRDSEIEDLISEILGSKKLSRGIKNKTPFKAPKFK